MKVVVFEACRSPRRRKPTEGILLSRIFKKQGIEYELFSNDFAWPKEERVNIDAALTLAKSEFPEFKSFRLCQSDDPMRNCSYLLPSGSRAFADPKEAGDV